MPDPIPCTNNECGHPTRQARHRVADYPGTRPRGLGGKCFTCLAADARGAAAAAPPPPPDPNPRPETLAGLDRFMAGRRAREDAALRREFPHLYRKDTA